ncbi:MAG TPA: hypothetical protein VHA56_00965 [Mucilaginibacter sp.]|nr:hypothetical protein [Mucilaginibacter sp.]
MSLKKVNLYFLFAMLMSAGMPAFAQSAKTWIVNGNSNLRVNGSTNINKFSCVIPSYGHTDTLILAGVKNSMAVSLSGDIDLQIKSFDCHNSLMTRDLRKTLRDDQFPLLHIRFISLSKMPDVTAQESELTGLVDIGLAGVQKRFTIAYRLQKGAGGNIRLLGSQQIRFSDFNLIPPRKLGGMIRTNDTLYVDFCLDITQVE